jgi:hypothetical protein
MVANLLDFQVKRDLDQYLFALTEVNDKNPSNRKEISVDPLIHSIYEDLGEMAKTHNDIIEKFWNSPVDFTDPTLEVNYSPFLVT